MAGPPRPPKPPLPKAKVVMYWDRAYSFTENEHSLANWLRNGDKIVMEIVMIILVMNFILFHMEI